MRIIPPLTAVAVSALLFGLIMERDSLMAFARGEDASAGETETAVTEPEVATEAEAISRVGVVALRSSARNIDNAVILRGQTRAMREVDVRAETSSTVISETTSQGCCGQ